MKQLKCLKISNIDTNDLYDRISDHLRKDVSTPRLNNSSTKKTLPFSDETKAIIKSLDKECEKLHDTMIDTTHIMLAILASRLPTTEILGGLGVNYNSFKQTMNNMKEDFNKNAFEGEEVNDEETFKRKPKQGDVKSKTPVLDNFCRDVSKAVERGEIDPVVGRAVEIKRVSQILSRRKKNNPILYR